MRGEKYTRTMLQHRLLGQVGTNSNLHLKHVVLCNKVAHNHKIAFHVYEKIEENGAKKKIVIFSPGKDSANTKQSPGNITPTPLHILMDAYQTYVKAHGACDTLLFPIAECSKRWQYAFQPRNHWVSLIVNINTTKNKATLVDSQRYKLYPTAYIAELVKNNFSTSLKHTYLGIQKDSHSCGPWTIETLSQAMHNNSDTTAGHATPGDLRNEQSSYTLQRNTGLTIEENKEDATDHKADGDSEKGEFINLPDRNKLRYPPQFLSNDKCSMKIYSASNTPKQATAPEIDIKPRKLSRWQRFLNFLDRHKKKIIYTAALITTVVLTIFIPPVGVALGMAAAKIGIAGIISTPVFAATALTVVAGTMKLMHEGYKHASCRKGSKQKILPNSSTAPMRPDNQTESQSYESTARDGTASLSDSLGPEAKHPPKPKISSNKASSSGNLAFISSTLFVDRKHQSDECKEIKFYKLSDAFKGAKSAQEVFDLAYAFAQKMDVLYKSRLVHGNLMPENILVIKTKDKDKGYECEFKNGINTAVLVEVDCINIKAQLVKNKRETLKCAKTLGYVARIGGPTAINYLLETKDIRKEDGEVKCNTYGDIQWRFVRSKGVIEHFRPLYFPWLPNRRLSLHKKSELAETLDDMIGFSHSLNYFLTKSLPEKFEHHTLVKALIGISNYYNKPGANEPRKTSELLRRIEELIPLIKDKDIKNSDADGTGLHRPEGMSMQ